MRTTPLRRTTLHFGHRRLTDELTFIVLSFPEMEPISHYNALSQFCQYL
jgi:hypothetical protein